ncbi:hypothetical protein SAMN05216389_101224 [Oceanobacillus limi]|uniref:Uncharacterized protein n=1 Tax=Oceanobacillus limi TaxID=930131 RepID=A0A1H9Y7T3_9BACI|nr:hypothetical protein [Oceanobacillus limi]SES64472.1 hypothetical protein SAMN05216389_101224 [Oceanobacillus limi]
MVNQDFDKFIKYQKKEKAIYPGHPKRGEKASGKMSDRKVSTEHPGATGRDIE